MVDDNQLIRQCLRRDRRAQQQLYSKYAPGLYAVALRYLKQPETAQDITAEAWVKIFSGLDSFGHKGSLQGWMRRILVNEALMYLRRHHRIPTLAAGPVSQMPIRDPEPTAHQELAYRDLLGLLDKLPTGCRTVFNLYELEGYKHREIASLLDISINTSKSQLILARKKLRQAYSQLYDHEHRYSPPTAKQKKP